MPAPREGAQAAVAAIAAAGNDTEALAEAIEQAAFLDDTPGENRQTLREGSSAISPSAAARTKLKKIINDERKKKELAEADAIANRSPHKKESYDAAEYPDLVAKYDKLNWRIISKPGGATVKPDDFYSLYGLHMMAEKGENTEERPMWAERGGLDFEGRAKWDAWTALKGMKPERAKLKFVQAYYEFTPKALYTDGRGGNAPPPVAPI